jgi:tRNA (guanine37-N1)-methyltransferase
MTWIGKEAMFRPPINRGMQVLDRACFTKKIPTSAARIGNKKNIAKYRVELEQAGDLLLLDRYKPLQPDPDQAIAANGGKCFVLKPEVKADGEDFSGPKPSPI